MFKSKRGFIAALFLSVALFSSSAFSYAYSPFSLTTGKSTFAVNPFVFANASNSGGAELFLAYGATDNIDLWFSYNTLNEYSVMARYSLGSPGIVAIKANHLYISPQYHFIWENERIALQANIAAQLDYATIDEPGVYGIFAPVVKFFGGAVDVFCEVNPGYYTQDESFANLASRDEGFDLDVVPGIGFAVGDVLFSVACPIYDVTNNPAPTFGAWAFFTVGR